MPEPVWIYLMALLYFTNLTSCSAMADAFDSVSSFVANLHGSCWIPGS